MYTIVHEIPFKLHNSHKPIACVVGFEKIWKKLSRKLNSVLWSPKLTRASQSLYQLSHKLVGRIRSLRATYTTLSTTPTSHVSHHAMGRGTQRQKI